ncbi:AEC family transporter [Nevskia ramosa]|uniref:AEC family transporter n=1 Tax=Nevskia ramosa TaxID=64002 RepID=UPI0023526F4F|nr:AEC family transporter [Nevskia ramosa]
MSAILLLALCLGIGLAMARDQRLPPGAPQALNFWIVNVALPALILVEIPKLHFSRELLFPAIAPWFVFFGAIAVFSYTGRRRNWSRGTTGAMILTCGLGNTAYMGLAMIEALRGPELVGAAVIADQFGSFTMLSIGGVIVAAYFSGAQPTAAQIVRRVFGFTPFLALVVALVLWPLGGLPDILQTVLTRIGQTLTPLALFSVGLQLKFRGIGEQRLTLLGGLGWKMLFAPLFVFGAALLLGLDINAPNAVAGILQCAMPPMVTAGILAEQYKLNPSLANLVIGIGTVLSLITLPLASMLL